MVIGSEIEIIPNDWLIFNYTRSIDNLTISRNHKILKVGKQC